MTYAMFDPEMLRSFATGVALGSFAKAADRLGRSTSAISAQLKKLEAQAGQPLVRKSGRGLALTDAGTTLLAYAHRLIDLNEEATAALRRVDLHGEVRLGLQEDFGETLLPAVLGRFARAHPGVRIEACVARSAVLRERLAARQLDLVLAWEAGERTPLPHGETLLTLPLTWLAAPGLAQAPPSWLSVHHGARTLPVRTAAEPLPLVLLDAPCPLREIATRALEQAGIPWRHAFTSASLAALWAATAAGLGITLRTGILLPSSVRALDPAYRLPKLPDITLSLYRALPEPPPPVVELAALLAQAVRQTPLTPPTPLTPLTPLTPSTPSTPLTRHGPLSTPSRPARVAKQRPTRSKPAAA